jgi:hypothetical protein
MSVTAPGCLNSADGLHHFDVLLSPARCVHCHRNYNYVMEELKESAGAMPDSTY